MTAHFVLCLAACLAGSIEPTGTAYDTSPLKLSTSKVSAAKVSDSEGSIEKRFDALAHEFASIRESLARVAPRATPDSVEEREPRWLRLAFRAQMSELADAGSARALAWLVAHSAVDPAARGSANEGDATAVESALYDRLLPHFASEPWLADPEFDVVTALTTDADALGIEHAAGLVHSIYAATPSAELRARALLAEARIIAPPNCSDRGRKARAVALLRDELAQHPTGSLADLCRNAIWRLEHLAPGVMAVDFSARDVDGNELLLSDYRDKVVLVDVWSFASPGCSSRLARRQALASRHQTEPFVLLGVNLDRDELAFRRAWESYELRFPCAFEGGLHGRVQSAWHLDGSPTCLLIDRRGIIRAVDLDGDALDAAVAELLAAPAIDASALEPPHLRR